ncbi:MAG TPA: hypothetical protein VFR37_00160, partial [Longimicrobium sp.]|nr:hypothetical protein [Longimicrobium sp.]
GRKSEAGRDGRAGAELDAEAPEPLTDHDAFDESSVARALTEDASTRKWMVHAQSRRLQRFLLVEIWLADPAKTSGQYARRLRDVLTVVTGHASDAEVVCIDAYYEDSQRAAASLLWTRALGKILLSDERRTRTQAINATRWVKEVSGS